MADTDKMYTSVAAEKKKMQLLKSEFDAVKNNKADKATTLAGYGIQDAYTKTEVNGLVDTPHQNYVTVQSTAQTTDATDVLPASGQAADTIYRVSNWDGSANNGAGAFDVTKYSEYAWDDASNPNKYVFLCVKTQVGEVFDISVYNNNATYPDLATALGTNGANVPQEIRRGGMTVKFVLTSEKKYVQYRLMTTAWSNAVGDWQGVDDEPTFLSPNLITSEAIANAIMFSPIIDNSRVNSAGGISAYDGWFVVDYELDTPIAEGDVIVWSGISANANCRIGFYLNGVNKDNYGATGNTRTITIVADNAVIGSNYIRATFMNSKKSSARVQINGIILKPLAVEKFSTDEVPTVGSEKLLTSGVIANELNKNDYVLRLNEKAAPYTLGVGSLYQNRIDSSVKNCLYNSQYIEVIPGSEIQIICANDITVRVCECNESKAYIRQNESYSRLTSLIVGATTHYVRIAANYSARGYSSSNPITTNDYQDGDFGIVVYESKAIKEIWSGIAAIETDITNMESYQESVKNLITNNYFTGKGNTYNSIKIPSLIPLHKYRITFKKLPWDMTGVTVTGVYKFTLESVIGTTHTILKWVAMNGTVQSYYDFTVPENCDYIQIGGRAADGELVYFEVFDKTLADGKVSFTESQSLTSAQKQQARENIGISDLDDAFIQSHNILVSAKSQKYLYPRNAGNSMIAFLVATDIHSDWIRFQHALDFANGDELIDTVLVLGDVCGAPAQLRNYDYPAVTNLCSKPVLTIPGNHEVAYNQQGGVVPFTDAELINKFYTQTMVEKNGDVHPTGKVWWYKDISHTYTNEQGNSETKSIRVIGFDQAEYCETLERNTWYVSQDQIDWLLDVLDATPADSYLLFLTHATMDANDELTAVDCKFTCSRKNLTYNILSNKALVTDIIRAWINGTSIQATSENSVDSEVISVNHTFANARTGKFIAFLSGHSHRDYVSRINGTEPIYQFNLHCTAAFASQQNGDIGRELTGKTQDCLTIFIYDWFEHRVKLVRVGADVTIDMKKRDFDVVNLV